MFDEAASDCHLLSECRDLDLDEAEKVVSGERESKSAELKNYAVVAAIFICSFAVYNFVQRFNITFSGFPYDDVIGFLPLTPLHKKMCICILQGSREKAALKFGNEDEEEKQESKEEEDRLKFKVHQKRGQTNKMPFTLSIMDDSMESMYMYRALLFVCIPTRREREKKKQTS